MFARWRQIQIFPYLYVLLSSLSLEYSCIFAPFSRHPTLFVICLLLVFDLLGLLCFQALLPMLFAVDADPSRQFVSSSPVLPCTSNLRLHSAKDKTSIFSHPKEAGQCTAALKKIKESRGVLVCPAGEGQQTNSYFWKGFVFPSSKSSWQQHASPSLGGCSLPRPWLARQAAAQSTRLSTAAKGPFLPMSSPGLAVT